MTEQPRPIFVVGFQRSGTTLLQSLLGAHPRIAAPPETHFIFRIAGLRDYFGDLSDDRRLRVAVHELLNPPAPILADSGFDEDRVFERAAAGPRTYASLLDALMRDFADRQGKPRWCEKTPIQPALHILDFFPNAQLVHIVRDPRDVVASCLEAPWWRGRADQLARAWKRFTLENIRVGADAGPQQYLQLRYEDLTRDPEAVLRIACVFLGEEYSPAMLENRQARETAISTAGNPWQFRVLEEVTAGRQGRWVSRLTRAQALQVNAVTAGVLPALGYEPVRRRSVWAGRLLVAGLRPADAPAALAAARLRRRPLSPEARHEEVQKFMRRSAESVTGRRG